MLYRAQAESPEFVQINKIGSAFKNLFIGGCKITIKGQNYNLSTPSKLLAFIIELGKKGLAIQRFKGLGEMNAEQLWETTLDSTKRTLLQVKVGDVDEAEQVISTLMGSVVEPRRDFINANALNVTNLDV
jgi:DNA gyrase subunit B